MTCYYLLRNNKELGPFTLKELKEMPLLTTDLIWVNGESTCWKGPDELEEFSGFATESTAVKEEKKTAAAAELLTVTTTSSSHFQPAPEAVQGETNPMAEEPLPEPSFEALKEKYAARAPRKKVWKSQINIGANLVGIATLVIGVSVAAFMIKKAVDNIEHEPIIATAEAQEIEATMVHMNTSSQSAMATPTDKPTMAASTTTSDPANANEADAALQKEGVTAPPAAPAQEADKGGASSKKGVKKVAAEKKPTVPPVVDKEKTEQEDKEQADANLAKAEKEQNESAIKSKPSLQLSANKYNVGFLGGISNLELLITNPSSEVISKATVEVEFLKPNGKVVGTQKVEVSGLAPNASKKIPIPDNGRGVSVRYRVVDVESN